MFRQAAAGCVHGNGHHFDVQYYEILQNNRLNNYLHVYALNVDNSLILIELGPGEF